LQGGFKEKNITSGGGGEKGRTSPIGGKLFSWEIGVQDIMSVGMKGKKEERAGLLRIILFGSWVPAIDVRGGWGGNLGRRVRGKGKNSSPLFWGNLGGVRMSQSAGLKEEDPGKGDVIFGTMRGRKTLRRGRYRLWRNKPLYCPTLDPFSCIQSPEKGSIAGGRKRTGKQERRRNKRPDALNFLLEGEQRKPVGRESRKENPVLVG